LALSTLATLFIVPLAALGLRRHRGIAAATDTPG
jgi:hypothetical protein